MSMLSSILLSTTLIAALIVLRILVTRSAIRQRLESHCAFPTCRKDDCLENGADARVPGGNRDAETAPKIRSATHAP